MISPWGMIGFTAPFPPLMRALTVAAAAELLTIQGSSRSSSSRSRLIRRTVGLIGRNGPAARSGDVGDDKERENWGAAKLNEGELFIAPAEPRRRWKCWCCCVCCCMTCCDELAGLNLGRGWQLWVRKRGKRRETSWKFTNDRGLNQLCWLLWATKTRQGCKTTNKKPSRQWDSMNMLSHWNHLTLHCDWSSFTKLQYWWRRKVIQSLRNAIQRIWRDSQIKNASKSTTASSIDVKHVVLWCYLGMVAHQESEGIENIGFGSVYVVEMWEDTWSDWTRWQCGEKSIRKSSDMI